MALKVRVIEGSTGSESMTIQLDAVLTEEGKSLADVYALPYGDNKMTGMILVFEE